jgi:hypothetical protein
MYVYEAINSYTTGPQLYIIYTTLDVDTQRAQNDGGLCSKLYEIGSGVGVMSPTNIGTGNGRMECN